MHPAPPGAERCCCVLGSIGVHSTSTPVEPEDWGRPLFTENPHAPLYPAGQQYTWVTNDVVVLQSISMRLPHQPGVFGAETVALTMASMFGMEDGSDASGHRTH